MSFDPNKPETQLALLTDKVSTAAAHVREAFLDGLADLIVRVLDAKEHLAALPERRIEGFKRFGIGFSTAFALVLIFAAAWTQSTGEIPSDHGMPTLAEQALITPTAPPSRATAVTASLDAFAPTPAVPEKNEATLKLRKGETLGALLASVSISEQEAQKAFNALREVYNPRKIQAGQAFTLVTASSDDGVGLKSLSFQPAPDRTVTVVREGEDFTASEQKAETTRRLVHRSGVIETSLYDAAMAAGFPQGALADMILAFSYDVDFQRDVRRQDTFEAMFEQYETPSGDVLKTGRILFARMTVGGKPLNLYSYTDKDGNSDYYDASGKSVRKALLRTPVNGARLSSRYGSRRHPILGFNKMHKGIDFAAPTGTPIYAAGDGIIEMARMNGGYGKYVRIRHNSTYSTAYAHMSGWAKGAREGARVKQGQVIGYIGSTGMSTGAHLHYEVLVNQRQTNPLGVKLPSGITLTGAELARFQGVREGVDVQLAALKKDADPTRVATSTPL